MRALKDELQHPSRHYLWVRVNGAIGSRTPIARAGRRLISQWKASKHLFLQPLHHHASTACRDGNRARIVQSGELLGSSLVACPLNQMHLRGNRRCNFRENLSEVDKNPQMRPAGAGLMTVSSPSGSLEKGIVVVAEKMIHCFGLSAGLVMRGSGDRISSLFSCVGFVPTIRFEWCGR